MKLTALAAGAAIAFSFVPIAEADWSVPDMNAQIDQTNFVVNNGCSGTLFDLENRYVLTANHCVTGQYETVEIEEFDEDGVLTKKKVRRLRPGVVRQLSYHGPLAVTEVAYRTKIIALDTDNDLAVLQILADIPNTVAASVACVEPVRGDTVFVVGNPHGMYSSVVTGIVSSLQRTYDTLFFDNADEALMQISGGLMGGNSGGAVYNKDGEIIGVSVLAHMLNETLGFAVPHDVVVEFLKDKKLLDLDCEQK